MAFKQLIAALALAGAAAGASAALRAHAAGPTPVSGFDRSCFVAKDPPNEADGGSGRSYRGLVSTTMSGRSCKRWTDVDLAARNIVSSADVEEEGIMKWGAGIGAHSYCRNPDGSRPGPWCFTLDGKEEDCAIPECAGPARDFSDEADTLKMAVEATGCDCAEQLYGSTVTTADTSVPLALAAKQQGRSHPSKKGVAHKHCDCAPAAAHKAAAAISVGTAASRATNASGVKAIHGAAGAMSKACTMTGQGVAPDLTEEGRRYNVLSDTAWEFAGAGKVEVGPAACPASLSSAFPSGGATTVNGGASDKKAVSCTAPCCVRFCCGTDECWSS